MTDEYALDWDEASDNVAYMVRDFLDDFKTGCLAQDLCFSLHLINNVVERSDSPDKADSSFSSFLFYDNRAVSVKVRAHYRQLTRKQTGTAWIPAYYEGTDRLSWAGTVLADMNGLHARPIIPAFVLACMQFREWHDLYFTASTSNIQFAFGANISILDLVSVGVYTELTLRSPLLPLPLRFVHSSPSTGWKETR